MTAAVALGSCARVISVISTVSGSVTPSGQLPGEDWRAKLAGVDCEPAAEFEDLRDLLDGGALSEGAFDVAADAGGVEVGTRGSRHPGPAARQRWASQQQAGVPARLRGQLRQATVGGVGREPCLAPRLRITHMDVQHRCTGLLAIHRGLHLLVPGHRDVTRHVIGHPDRPYGAAVMINGSMFSRSNVRSVKCIVLLQPIVAHRGQRAASSSAKNVSADLVLVACSPVRSMPRSLRKALLSAATWKASAGGHLVESSRIRDPSG